jgi:hypothetical protein
MPDIYLENRTDIYNFDHKLLHPYICSTILKEKYIKCLHRGLGIERKLNAFIEGRGIEEVK